MQTSKLIVFEGMPGAGKTTLVNRLTERNNLPGCFAIEQLTLRQDLVENLETSIEYIDAELERIKRAQQEAPRRSTLLFDRSALTTLAFRYAKSTMAGENNEYQELLKYLTAKIADLDIRPNLLILFDVSIEESMNRRRDFSENPLNKTWFNKEFLSVLQGFYRNLIPEICIAHNNVCIDTTRLSIDQVAENAELIINLTNG